MNEWEKLFAQAKEKLIAAKALLANDQVDMKQVKALQDEAAALEERANALKASQAGIDRLSAGQLPAALPTGGDGNQPAVTPPATDQDATIKAIRVLRYGQIDEATDRIMAEAYGTRDYLGLLDGQRAAFKTYLRTGRGDAALGKQLWSAGDVTGMLKAGMSMGEVKTTMVEGQDTLGGYAVPPDVSAQIIARMRGLTAVRDGGALIVQTASKALEWLKLTGGGDQYPTGLRGAWGAETQTPTAKNFTVGLLQIPVHIYTYKTGMSVSLIEDAGNLVQIFTDLVADTLAIDEDTTFLVGDGAGKPEGILPDSANGHSLTEVVSQSGSTLTIAGLKALRRGVASQYRISGRATLVGESATGNIIEGFQDGTGRFYFESLDHGSTSVYGATWRESESMPTVTGAAYPLIYGNMSGFAIVERLGMAIQRYNDSNTGINVVEFHIRRRIGGKVIEPWKFAVQKVAAS